MNSEHVYDYTGILLYMDFKQIRQNIIDHPMNAWAKDLGYVPVYTASAMAKIVIIGQAPGIHAQTTLTPWNDRSGDTLRDWLGIDKETFYDETKIALIPMDFYYPGKGAHGDLPPRKDFAPLWHPQLFALMPSVQLILLVGRYSQLYYLGKQAKKNLAETVYTYQDYLPLYMPLVHPSPLNIRWRARNPWFETQIVPIARELVATILNN
jgi:uracil-DNA glycosylase